MLYSTTKLQRSKKRQGFLDTRCFRMMVAPKYTSKSSRTGRRSRTALSSLRLLVVCISNFILLQELTGVAGDAQKFLKGEVSIMAGYENIIFGKAIPELGGTDGILPKDL